MPRSCNGATICCSMFPMVDLSPAQTWHVSEALLCFAMMHEACALQQQRSGNPVEEEVELCGRAASFDEASASLQRPEHHCSTRTRTLFNRDVALMHADLSVGQSVASQGRRKTKKEVQGRS